MLIPSNGVTGVEGLKANAHHQCFVTPEISNAPMLSKLNDF